MPKGSSRTVKNIIKLISVAAVILVIYSASSIVNYKLWNPQADKYTRSDQGSDYSINDNVDQTPIYLNWDDYIDALMNSAFFDSMSDLEKAQFIADLLGEDVGDYIANQNLTADEFLDMYGDDLTDMLGSMSGENFSSDLFDQFDDPMLLGAILAKPMFYAYEDNPFGRPWSDKDSTLFKISAYDEYSLENYDWTLGTLDNSGPYSGEGISDDIKYKIKYPLIITQSAMTPIPTLSTRPRIYNESLQSSPITPVGGIALRNQAYLGNVNLMTNFDTGDIGQSTNFTYQLLYDPADFEPSTYYSSLSYSMSDFTGNDAAVSACLSGPIQAGGSEMDWSAYATQNPNFNSVNQALQSDPSFTSATNTYEKMDAIVNYIGTNFVYNMMGQQRPPSGQDPIEWFCGSKESSFPFEFSALAVALGRLNDISCRYVSGYKNNDLLRLQGLPNSFTDADEGNQQGYIYYLGDTYTWMEVYIPTSSTTGDWIEMDNQFNATPTVPNPEDMRLNLKFDGNWQPDPNGIDRFGQYAEDTEVSVEVNYTSAGSPMRSQTLSLYDQTYGRSISSFYTNTNGIASYTLNLANLEPGPHLLNFSTSYLGYTFSNLSIIDVVDDIDIYEVVNQTNYQVGANTNVTTHYSGYAWDPVLNRPVKNALITYSALKWPTVTDPTPTPPTYIPSPGYTVTDQTGNFSVDLDIMGYPIGDSGRNYTITSLFAAAFNITSDVQTLPAPYQALLALQFGPTFLYQQFGDYATYSWQNNTQFELKTDNYYHYIFGINTASADNSTTANYPNGPAFGLRSGPFSITLSAQLLNQTGGIDTTQINVTDETEGGRFLTTLTTDSNGLASQVYDISTEAAGNASLWTVGPHLIKMQWNQDSNAESYFWIFIEAPIMVDQSTEYYLDGKAGILPNRYHIDNRNPGDADPFNMTGTIQDAGTGEWLSPNFTIDYQLLDSNWQVMTFITSLNGTQTQIESTITSFHQNFRFLGSISLAASPVRTNIAFLGEWADLGYNWTNSWASTYWQTYFTSLGTSNDTSDGVMYLSDPSTSGFSVNGFVNGTQFSTYPSNTYDTTVRLNSTLNFTGQFMHDGFLIDGASITLLLNGNPLSSSVTGANGTINFPLVVIDNSLTPGNLNFTVKASYTSISGTFIEVQQDILWVPYDPTIGFEQDYLLENQLFSSYGSAYPITQGPGDSLNFSVHLWYNSGDGKVYDWANANIELRIDGILNSSTTTDAQGYATIIYNFGTWSTNGTHAFSLSISYNSGTFIYTDNVAIDVDYDENLLHQYKAWINGVPFENYPGYNYPNIQGSGDTVNISIQFLFDENHDKNYIPQQWVLITYTNDTYTEQIYTDANGYANFSIQFTSWANVGTYTFSFSMLNSSINYGYTISESKLIHVQFDPASKYTLLSRLDGVLYSDGYNYPVTQILNDIRDLSSAFYYYDGAYNPVLGANTTIIYLDKGLYQEVDISGADGYGNFSVVFDNSFNSGTQRFKLLVTFTDIYGFLISKESTIQMTYDPTIGYSMVSRFNGINFEDYSPGYSYPFDQLLNDTIDFSIYFDYSGTPVTTGATVSLYDDNGATLLGNLSIDGSGNVNFTTMRFNETMTAGTHTFKIVLDFTNSSYSVHKESIMSFNYTPTGGFSFTPMLDSNTSFDYVIKNSGEFANITYRILHQGVGVEGATVTLSDLVNGTTYPARSDWQVSTDANGYGSILVYCGSFMHSGAHRYDLSILYNFGLYSVSDSNNSIWVIYNTTLAISASRTEYNNKFSITNDGSPISITGTLVAQSLSYGHLDAVLQLWVYDSLNSDITSWFTVNLNYYNDDTDGAFSYTISQTAGGNLNTGNISVIIGFSGTLSDGPISYRYVDSLRVNTSASAIQIEVFDQPILTPSEYGVTNPGIWAGSSTILPGLSNITINGTMTYSNGTAIVGENVTITIYDENDAPLVTLSALTDASGFYEITFHVKESWAIEYYTIEYLGNDLIYLMLINPIIFLF